MQYSEIKIEQLCLYYVQSPADNIWACHE